MYEGNLSSDAGDLAPDVWTGAGPRTVGLPEGFGSLPPGPGLAAAVSHVDLGRLIGRDLVSVLTVVERLISHYQAVKYRVVAELEDIFDGDPQLTAAEIAAALHLTRAASETDYLLASGLRRFPQIADALSQGTIDLRRAKVLIDATVGLDLSAADTVVVKGLSGASELTTGQLRARLIKHRFEADPAEANTRYRAGIEDRRVVVSSNPDGTANLHALNLPPDKLMAIRRRINSIARRVKTPGDGRTADQRRADTLIDLLATSNGGSNEAGLTLIVTTGTLAGGDTPAEIPGFGPILADIARQAATDCHITRGEYIITDNGQPIATGTLSRMATRAMTRHLRAAQPTCIFPGCRMPAQESDLDHRRTWAIHHQTRLPDLAPLCRYHHLIRHKGWNYQITPTGTIHWTSPTGHAYTTSGTDPP